MNILQKRTAFIVTAAFLLAFVFSIVSLSHYKGEEHLFSIQESYQLKKITNGISAPDNNSRDHRLPSGNGPASSSNSGEHVTPFHNLSMDNGAGSQGANKDYETPLALYTVGFFIAAAFVYGLLKKKKWHHSIGHSRVILWSLLGTGLFIRIALIPWVGSHMDASLFKNWASVAANHFSNFYAKSGSDYPPFYIYILFIVGKVGSLPDFQQYFSLLIKIPPILADVITSYLLYRLARRYLAPSFAYLLAIGYLFNPAILVNSTFWGQVDSFFTLLIVLAIVMITEKRIYASAVIFTAAVLMKPQAIIILPILFFELIRLKQVKHFFGIALTAAFTAVAILLPFSIGKSPTWIIDLFSSTIGEYPYASVNAYNFFSLIGANYKDSSATLLFFSYHTWGLIFIVATTVFSWLIYIKGRSFKYAALAALIQISGVFTFASSMHERYLFPAAALALLAYIYLKDKNLLYLSLGFSISIFMNTFFVLYGDSNMQNSTSYPFSMFATSMLNVLLVVYLVKVAWNLVQKSTVLKTA
ncbi:glycosyltransferase family 39 protein [Priestia megaterium]|jgi:Gpi18-like mannosyltransferase|uniref:Glycosyltransferase RgtA/B/C/D-like domain-containing protein n=3 Tax=Priestia megaterium TaxID=1404 RepID=A0AAE5P7Q7_PRIMG|nr:glycosyltransferase family 39 protein [Priestia megaterium]RFB29395.1 hypothetical protein DZB87_02675 [Bacillus sp. ALD]RFB41203.1 hypothetical protein DZB86_10295 [Bacillus sp. RC]MBM6599461.1 glycosyltransferase family 39 protein [Priestia megaterium]MBV6735235.1 glycosyltransferase family 39 protein [Priestia megaterium]MBW0929168.1 glycosyltransferase family 39 protein [Priestia megaterium]